MELRKKSAILIAAMLLLSIVQYTKPINVSATTSTTVYPWPTLLGNNQRTGMSNSPVPDQPGFLWKKEIEGVFGVPVIAEGKVFVTTKLGIVYAFDQETGEILWWKKLSGNPYGPSSPTFWEGKLYVSCWTAIEFPRDIWYGHLYILDTSTGNTLRKIEFSGKIYDSPLVVEGKIYIGNNDLYSGNMYCIDTDTGKTLWKNGLRIGGCSPALYENNVYVGYTKLHAVNKDTGEIIWNSSKGILVSQVTPVISNGKVLGVTRDAHVSAFDCYTGNTLWTSDVMVEVYPAAVAYGKVFNVPSNGRVIAMNETDGKKIWEVNIEISPDQRIYAGRIIPAIADRKIFISYRGDIYALNVDDGGVVWHYRNTTESFTSPAIADNKIFVATYRDDAHGSVYAFGSKLIVQKRTQVEILKASSKMWNVLNIPFNYDSAKDYIRNFQQNGKPEAQFGDLEVNVDTENVGNEKAKNVQVRGTIEGYTVMVIFEEDKMDYVVLHEFKYSFNCRYTLNEGTIDVSTTQKVNLKIPVKYMTLLVGPFKVWDSKKWESEQKDITVEVLFAIGEYDITLEVYGDNFDSVKLPSKLKTHAIGGNPKDVLEQLNEALAERAHDERQKALIEYYMSTMNLDSEIFVIENIPGKSNFDTTIPQDATSMTVTTIVPQGVSLTELLITIGTTAVAIPLSFLTGIQGITAFIIKPPLLEPGKTLKIALQTSTSAGSGGLVANQQMKGKLIITTVRSAENHQTPFDTNTILVIALIIILAVAVIVVMKRKKKNYKK